MYAFVNEAAPKGAEPHVQRTASGGTMNHQGTKRIETERLILRRFAVEDAEAAYRNWCCDPGVTHFLTWLPHEDLGATKEIVASWVAGYADPTFYQWAIELRALGEPIGSISAVNVNENIAAIEVGYCLGSPWWHQGIMTEAFGAVIDFFFGEVGADRVWAEHDTNNPRSGYVMRACGLSYEGTLRQANRNNQGVIDTCIYSILRSEWEECQRP